MLLNIPIKYNKTLYEKTYTEIAKVKGVTITNAKDDYELISVMADGKPLKKVIDIVLKRGIAE